MRLRSLMEDISSRAYSTWAAEIYTRDVWHTEASSDRGETHVVRVHGRVSLMTEGRSQFLREGFLRSTRSERVLDQWSFCVRVVIDDSEMDISEVVSDAQLVTSEEF
ncbi:hypothetical protein Tco_1142325 [Tanacetum coccineum]